MQRFFKLGLLALTTLAISQPSMAQKDRRAETSPDDDSGVKVAQKDNRGKDDCPVDGINFFFSGVPAGTSIMITRDQPKAPKGKDSTCTDQLLFQILRGARSLDPASLISGKDRKNTPDDDDEGGPVVVAGTDGKSSSQEPGANPGG